MYHIILVYLSLSKILPGEHKGMGFKSIVRELLAIVLIVLLWKVLSIFLSSPLFPGPDKVLLSLVYLLLKEELLIQLGITFSRVLIGLFLGILTGFIVGVLVTLSSFLRDLVYPLIVFFIVTPSFAFIPLLILWIGLNDWLPISLVIICSGFPIAYAIISSSKNIDPDIIDVALSLGARRHILVFKIVLPMALTHIFSLLKLETSHALRLVFVAEYLAISSGLGYLMAKAYSLLRVDEILAIIILLGFLGLILTYALEFIETRIMEKRGFMRH